MKNPFKVKGNSKKVLLRLLDAYQQAVDFNIICSITNEQGKIVYVNNRFCQVSKFSKEELLGQNHRIVNSGYHSKEFFKNMWDTISGGKVWRGEVKSKAKDGTYFWLDSTIIPIFNEQGKIIQYFSLRMPIDDKKALEIQKEKRLSSLEEMLFQLSHKIRQPIVQILGVSSLLNHSTISQTEQKKLLEYIKESANQLDDLTRELTEYMVKERMEITQ
jgi:PAS domain S-box-containing protein